MPLADSLGLNYALPDNRYITSQTAPLSQQAGAAPVFDLPDPTDELAYVDHLTEQYLDTRGKIEKYALDMQKRYGVDVTQPDYSKPGGGQPFKGYNQLATKLLLVGNDLKTSMTRQKTIDQGVASGQIRTVEGFDPTAQPINRLNAGQMFHSTRLLPQVMQANEILKTAVYTSADQDRFKREVADPLVAELTAAMNKEGISPAEKQYLQYNIDALVQQPRSTPYAFFQNAGSGRKDTVEIDFLKKATNLAQGKWEKGTYDVDTDETGNPVLVNRAFDGLLAGEYTYSVDGIPRKTDRIIDSIVKKADGIYFTFKQQEGVPIPPVKVSSKAGDDVAKDIITANSKFGSVPEMYKAMRELGLSDDSGSLINEKLLAGEEFDTPDPSSFAPPIEAEKDRIKKELEEKRASPGVWDRKSAMFNLPGGKTITFYPNRIGGGWYSDDVDGENMTTDDVVKFLAEEKYFNQFLNKPNAQASNLVTVPELQPLPGETQAAYDIRRIRLRKQNK